MKIENLFDRLEQQGVTFESKTVVPEEEETDLQTRMEEERLAQLVAEQMGISLGD